MTFVLLPAQSLLDNLYDTMHTAPNDERPVSSMPDAANQEGNKNVPIGSWLAATAATHRDIHLTGKPTGERDVPALPKVGNAGGKIRTSEVVYQVEAQCPCYTYRHQRIACKVAVYL